MKNLLFCLLLLLTSGLTHAQRVANVDWNLDASQENILITYDLIKEGAGSNQYFQVSVKATLNDKPLNIASLIGDIGGYVKAGVGKRIVWAWASDVSEIEGNLKFTIVAVDPLSSNPTPANPAVNPNAARTTPTAGRPVPPWAGITGSGGLAVTGIGLGVAGLSQISNSRELYTVYETNLDPSAAVYSELSRDEHYTEANAQFKKGQWFSYGGLAILAAGGYLMVSRIVGYNKLKKNAGFSVAPTFQPNNPSMGYGFKPQPGLRLGYRF